MDLPMIIMFACFLATMGGGAQQIVSGLAGTLPKSHILANLVFLTSALTAFAMAYFGSWLSGQFIGLQRAVLVAGGLLFAAIALFRSEPIASMREPTRSIGAIFLTLTGKQALDAPRWLAFAGGAAIVELLGIALGATFGSAMALLSAWIAPEMGRHSSKLRLLRIGLAMLALSVAAFVVWIGATAGG
uniref:hypothetical protein n=1 Tax=uncultured Altererythrobacter sp. TaxID=500840 RepID=UPI002614D62C|nr:hypothetical protein [uncultured Altererythrobacter sp.]